MHCQVKILLTASVLVLQSCISSRPVADLHSVDFTAENLFTKNIEGPAFDRAGNLYVVNFQQAGTIGKIDEQGECELFVTLPAKSIANSIQFNSRGDMLLADFPMHNVLRVDMRTKGISIYCHTDAFNQPNDICINMKDQLFASDPKWADSTGNLWRIDADGSPVLLESGMGTTNGIALSPDERFLYVNESIQRRVWRYNVDGDGGVSEKKLLIEFQNYGMDGMKCDSEGNLYIARFGKGTIAVVSPEGILLREVQLRGKNCTNLTFGGLDGRTVFVTLNDRKGLEKFRNDIPGKGTAGAMQQK
ncbi:MAG: SMP-30/gluconolactonase/LRE family protein [Ignavibacteriales bacterium]|nr:SMP-30/gluconolactonase/LRE family protein [Ignavibacteriales bacterium]